MPPAPSDPRASLSPCWESARPHRTPAPPVNSGPPAWAPGNPRSEAKVQRHRKCYKPDPKAPYRTALQRLKRFPAKTRNPLLLLLFLGRNRSPQTQVSPVSPPVVPVPGSHPGHHVTFSSRLLELLLAARVSQTSLAFGDLDSWEEYSGRCASTGIYLAFFS